MSSHMFNALLVVFHKAAQAFKKERPESELVASIEKVVERMEKKEFRHGQDVGDVMAVLKDAEACLKKMLWELPSESRDHKECENLVYIFSQINERKIKEEFDSLKKKRLTHKMLLHGFTAQVSQCHLKATQKKLPLALR